MEPNRVQRSQWLKLTDLPNMGLAVARSVSVHP